MTNYRHFFLFCVRLFLCIQGCHFKLIADANYRLKLYFHRLFSSRAWVPDHIFWKDVAAYCCRNTVYDSCRDLRYFSGFNPVLEENIKIRKHGMPSWIQITDFFAFKSCSSCLLGVFRNVFTGWSTMTKFHQNYPSRKLKVVKTAWQKVSTVTLTISVIYMVNTDTTHCQIWKKRDTCVLPFFGVKFSSRYRTVLFMSHDSCLSHLAKKHVLLRIRWTAHFLCEFLSLVFPNFMAWVLGRGY